MLLHGKYKLKEEEAQENAAAQRTQTMKEEAQDNAAAYQTQTMEEEVEAQDNIAAQRTIEDVERHNRRPRKHCEYGVNFI